jgi:lysyl-tRNA synthetase class 2
MAEKELGGREEQIVGERLRKIKELRDNGINPYPQNFKKKDENLSIQKMKLGTKIKSAGRVINQRDFGKIAFAKLRDSSGEIQIVIQEGETSDKVREMFKKYVDVGDFIGFEGDVIKTKTGEISVLVKSLEVLSKGIFPLPSKFHGLADKEERYRKRYVDLIMNPEVKKVFDFRSKFVKALREFMDNKGFVEVETPTLQSVYGGASATPFKTHLNYLDIDLFLSISPELYLKRLVVGGYDKVFTICKNFRNEGIDHQHNPEFTMIEYYAAYENYEYHIEFTEEFFSYLIKNLGVPEKINYRGNEIKLKPPFKRITFRDLIHEKTKIDIDKVKDFDSLKKEIEKRKLKDVDVKGKKHYGALLDELYKRVARPSIIQPTFLTHYPVEMIALAKRNDKDPTKINSVQLLIDGAEVLKAYDELNDPVDQENRLREQQKLLNSGDSEAMPLDEDFIESLKYGMPPTAGFGMGIDRIVMILTGQDSIRDVLLFPFMKPISDEKINKEKKPSKK